jgi:hypothetical protein
MTNPPGLLRRAFDKAMPRPIAWQQGFWAGSHDMNPYPRGDRLRAVWADGHEWHMMIVDKERAR